MQKLPLADLQLDFSWSQAKLTLVEDLHKALVTASRRPSIVSSWQKAGLTRCLSGEMFVEASRRQSIRDSVEGSALPNEMDDVMDDEEEIVLCRGGDQGAGDADEGDQGCQPGSPWFGSVTCHCCGAFCIQPILFVVRRYGNVVVR